MSRIRKNSKRFFPDVSLYVTPETPDVTPQICQNCLRSHANFACSKIEMDLTGISNGLDQETINMLEQTVFDSSLLQVRLMTKKNSITTSYIPFATALVITIVVMTEFDCIFGKNSLKAFKLSCDSRFQRAFTACSYVFK